MDYFTEAIARGVSANLCEAIVGMSESGGGKGLEIGLRWAPARPARGTPPVKVSFPADTMPLIGEAARIFRQTPPREGFEVEGYVVKLARRGEVGDEGIATIASFLEGNERLINVKLDGTDYHRAVQAHDYGIRVICYGHLTKQGGQFVLLDPREFTLIEDW